MRRLLALAALLVTPQIAAATQKEQPAQDRRSPAESPLRLEATRLFQLPMTGYFPGASSSRSRFRAVLRVRSTTQDDLPVVVIGGGPRNPEAFNWSAVTSSGASCYVRAENVTGVDVFGHWRFFDISIERLQRNETSSRVRFHRVRPTLITAEFHCDALIEQVDTATLQIYFMVRDGGQWTPVSSTFADLPIGRN